MKKRFEVLKHEQGMNLLPFLRDRWPSAPSVKALKRAIDNKRCTINGRVETFSTHSLSKGDRIEIELIDEKPKMVTALYEDDAIIVCNKPSGIVSDVKNFSAQLVHRLDKETSGVLVLAKTELVWLKMVELFTTHQVKKEYLAIVDGAVLKKEGKIENRLAKRHQYEGQTIYASSMKGETAITHWKCLGIGNKASIVLCEPLTGRTHQLRVHLKGMGHPILGDSQYAKKFTCPMAVHRHMLHALKIVFPHPLTRQTIEASAPIPEDFWEVLEALGMAHLVEFLSKA